MSASVCKPMRIAACDISVDTRIKEIKMLKGCYRNLGDVHTMGALDVFN